MSEKLLVRRAAVLGAGVMGAQIAAHLTNAGVDTVLFDLPAKQGPADGIVLKAIANLGKLSPAPLASKALAEAITAANYGTPDDSSGLEQLRECDLIIEAIAERMDWKQELYRKIAPFVSPTAVLASNTSGLGINALADVLPEQLRHRFCGVHFFNPPRYMHLAELIPARTTDKAVLEGLEAFLVTTLGKGVVYAKDTPNFIGNRIGVFSILSTIHHTEAFGLGFDEVDALTGPLVGRPKSATYRTSDVVGLDTMAHVIANMAQTLPDDPWHQYFKSPQWLEALVSKGALGQKTGAGIFRKAGKDIVVLDLEKLGSANPYRPADRAAAPEVVEILKIRDPAEKFARLRESQHPQARFLWATFRDLFHYSAYHLADIAETARDVDLAIRWGYGWSLGPFETWQAAGWKQVAQWIADDIVTGKSMSSAPLPDWVFDGRDGVHAAEGSYSPVQNAKLPRSALPVYRRQRFPDPLLGEQFAQGETVFENQGVRMWHDGDEVAVVSFKTKMNTVSDQVLDGLQEVVGRAERDFKGLVIWQHAEPFSAGADLAGVLGLLQAGKIDAFEAMVTNFQATSQRIKYSLVPVVAAVRGLALGGGCEFQMHGARTVAGLESYIGLVEAGVGLLPAGGGLKELAVRASEAAGPGGDVFAELKKIFETIAMAKVSTSAINAKELGLLRTTDKVAFNPYESLYIARNEACALAESGYRPPLPARRIQVAGDVGIATFKMLLVNMLEGRFISEYDYEIASRIATVLCGGEVDRGALVDEQWLLQLERRHFVELAQQDKTQARISHMLKTGKPLRN
ncbi:3-hydroxyacyl-CoA dehydrogenase/enoyl-CoA hydratase family protein [Pseudoxanthomonas spadix]|uniref:3-hydroxyacyl-CoA dehydrogenase/enoyl-CoA hydratase family protein n=1 Tax=Pseudoxanthomonas spadix TaxID=415229 RepID=UPI000EFF6087|nr:3-hydroxyacyl-CoA dehydrogenase/enoyl-CoA hydratase family protein [Pseudoxanthomonas spadix]MBP3973666.1 3-hydroxyacyl-CoA dehydrogenase/enoyl-CoA hydratase family protein [Pseudoxanthomonas spadix]RMW98124.1 3-hydroxyacyl-CoA dehydrogenase/enoyl-CoA hydratase family protein [Pseudoxanthomonas spadix]